MGQVLHGSATTTHAIRTAIQRGRGSYVGAQGTGGQGGSRRIGPADQPTPTDWPPNARRVQGGQRRKAPCPPPLSLIRDESWARFALPTLRN
ncbi:hypothetical protein DCM75_19660 [Bradyrhizobium sp. WBOS02]|nr:hypothetical protein DCK84_18905 [Bradyrhizobium sp. WBOS01]UUO42732.1 hypothetical protein DCM75_19660 [Bradyrhizobium sp. WBOS02]